MPVVYTKTFDTPLFKGAVSVNTGLFINDDFADSVEGDTIEYVSLNFVLDGQTEKYRRVLHPCSCRQEVMSLADW